MDNRHQIGKPLPQLRSELHQPVPFFRRHCHALGEFAAEDFVLDLQVADVPGQLQLGRAGNQQAVSSIGRRLISVAASSVRSPSLHSRRRRAPAFRRALNLAPHRIKRNSPSRCASTVFRSGKTVNGSEKALCGGGPDVQTNPSHSNTKHLRSADKIPTIREHQARFSRPTYPHDDG